MLQGSELVVILLVALVVFGPERLPELARKVGAWAAELRKAANEVRAGLEAEIKEVRDTAEDVTGPLKEVTNPLKDVTGPLKEVTNPLKDVTNPLKDVTNPLKDVRSTLKGKPVTGPLKWVGPIPKDGPTPADAMEDFARIEGTPVPPAEEKRENDAPPDPSDGDGGAAGGVGDDTSPGEDAGAVGGP